MEDHRFSPIRKEELPHLSVAVSLLVDYEECGALDWEVGTHGIIIKYRGRSAVFLPEVAPEQGWDQRTTLQHLLRKAGLSVTLNEQVVAEIHCTRFQSSKVEITYQRYTEMQGEIRG